MMTYLEKYKKIIENTDTNQYSVDCELRRILFEDECDGLSCEECLKKTLLKLAEEYNEPVELSQFEYDFINIIDKHNPYHIVIFKKLQGIGYFKNVGGKSIDELLENCVVKNDERDMG